MILIYAAMLYATVGYMQLYAHTYLVGGMCYSDVWLLCTESVEHFLGIYNFIDHLFYVYKRSISMKMFMTYRVVLATVLLLKRQNCLSNNQPLACDCWTNRCPVQVCVCASALAIDICVCVCACVGVCVGVRACACVCVHACVSVRVYIRL